MFAAVESHNDLTGSGTRCFAATTCYADAWRVTCCPVKITGGRLLPLMMLLNEVCCSCLCDLMFLCQTATRNDKCLGKLCNRFDCHVTLNMTGFMGGEQAALDHEAQRFSEMAATPESESLIGLFEGSTALKKNRFGRPVKKVRLIVRKTLIRLVSLLTWRRCFLLLCYGYKKKTLPSTPRPDHRASTASQRSTTRMTPLLW